ncbi:methyltransferase, FkbM family [Verrucomicrobium sp. GAS474]|uniref:FkbM family methyltransferase n=1 Tax=Verrucomicrobium sp. GAS474 TaxID=1882831 RepID=UPI00087B9C35|nr:FkbM family methyltransferase [Verrucomicrobium sp. GAS474]SDT99864.1 methyltransferase, FkbM family [Verrucomicrobium sp. GAS474]
MSTLSLVLSLVRYGGLRSLPGLAAFLACKAAGVKAGFVLRLGPHRWLARSDRPSGLRFFHEVVVRRSYEALAAELRRFPAPVIFDVGANCGAFALWALSVNPRARVRSFEPGSCFDILDANRELYMKAREEGREGDWRVEHCGISSSDGFVCFEEDADSSMVILSAKGTRRFPVRTLDGFSPAPEIVKIDIEGHELEALKGAEQTLRTARVVFLEYHGIEMRVQCAAFLRERGFEVRDVPGTELLLALKGAQVAAS